MKKNLIWIALASSCLLATQAQAMTREEHKAAEDRIEAAYKADKQRCAGLSGNAEDVCEAQAKGKEKVAKAELEAQYKPSDKAHAKVAEAKADAAYDIAKEKCDDLDVIEGKREQLLGRIQERHGVARDEAERQVREWEERNPDIFFFEKSQ